MWQIPGKLRTPGKLFSPISPRDSRIRLRDSPTAQLRRHTSRRDSRTRLTGSAYGAASTGPSGAPADQPDNRLILAAQMAYDNEKKTPLTMWLLWFFLGGIGGHRFYLGDTGYALAMLFLNWLTLGIWALIDAFLISNRLTVVNSRKQREIFHRYGLLA